MNGEYVTELYMTLGADYDKKALIQTLNVEYEDLMYLAFYDNLETDTEEPIHIRFGARSEIGDRVRQMCINLYNGGSIDAFDYGESFCLPCDGYSSDEYESDMSEEHHDDDHVPDPVGDQPDPMWIDGAIDGDNNE